MPNQPAAWLRNASRLTLQRIALFQSAFNEDGRAGLDLPETEYVIDASKRPWEGGYKNAAAY